MRTRRRLLAAVALLGLTQALLPAPAEAATTVRTTISVAASSLVSRTFNDPVGFAPLSGMKVTAVCTHTSGTRFTLTGTTGSAGTVSLSISQASGTKGSFSIAFEGRIGGVAWVATDSVAVGSTRKIEPAVAASGAARQGPAAVGSTPIAGVVYSKNAPTTPAQGAIVVLWETLGTTTTARQVVVAPLGSYTFRQVETLASGNTSFALQAQHVSGKVTSFGTIRPAQKLAVRLDLR